jgi:L-ribulose-5-phosphate 4-epimerase
MNPQEGVIKYQLHHIQKPIPNTFSLSEINAWRTIIFRLGLIGQTPDKYDNCGFGNISQRLTAHSAQFIISGTQTGHLEHLRAEQYCLVIKAEPTENRIDSCGLSQPSSESLTHASVYAQDHQIQAVIHVHSPEIWRHTCTFDLAHTAADIPYGTVAMANAVEQLFQSGAVGKNGIFTLLGHEDGVIAFGNNLQEAAWILIRHLALAIGVEQQNINR